MSAATTISVTVAPELLLRTQKVAESEHLTVDELLLEALRAYLASTPTAPLDRWNALREWFASTASELGITSDEDIEQLSDSGTYAKSSA